MKTPRHKSLLEKSVAAAVSAIEIYNKPNFMHREETFAILMTNAWELLFKAKILKDNKNKLRSIYELKAKPKKSGTPSKVLVPKTNRSGNPMTISLQGAMDILRGNKTNPLESICIDNISLLMEIRDNSVHFMNMDRDLALRIQEIGTATLVNYLTLAREWFGYDLTKYNFYLMPLSFFHEADVKSFSVSPRNQQVANLVKHFQSLEKANPSNEKAKFNITLKVETRFVKATSGNADLEVVSSKNPGAVNLVVSEEDYLKKFPMTYDDLVKNMNKRYTDFKINKAFHDLRKKLVSENKKYSHERYLDPQNPKSGKKTYYSDSILIAFDKHYSKKTS